MTLKLHQIFGAHAGRVVEFKQDRLRIGRLPSSDLAFDANADRDASGRHAEIRREGDTYFVIDLGSRNGTWLNDARVQNAPLADGDILEFGRGGPRVRVDLRSHANVGGPPELLPDPGGSPSTPEFPATWMPTAPPKHRGVGLMVSLLVTAAGVLATAAWIAVR